MALYPKHPGTRSEHIPEALLTPAEMAVADRLAAENGQALMENAGRAVARAIRARYRPCKTLVLCGPGNNAGDGYVAARLLAQTGWPIAVAANAPPRDASDAAQAAARWQGPKARFGTRAVRGAALVIDALYGAGLSREVDGIDAECLREASRIVAIDTPSGVDGNTGAIRGFAPQAELTVTFFRRKPGHLLLPGRDLCGTLLVADIGISARVLDTIRPDTLRNTPGLWRLPSRAAGAHKYSAGTVTICGGAQMTGAARLAASAARRAGAGLVCIAAEHGADIYRAGDPGLIVLDAPLAELLSDQRRKIWVCGPGLGVARARTMLQVLLAANRTVVADADALTAFAGHPEALRGAAVLTPHEGEFFRLFGDPGRDRLAAARAAARRTGAVVVLKGSDTVIAHPGGLAAINDNAPPSLATAGSGDVLAGLIAALLAQAMPPFEAACAAVWLHGEAATLAGQNLIAEDLLKTIRAAWGRAGIIPVTDGP